MARIEPIDLNQAEGKAKTLLEGVQKNLGMTPNLIRTMANSAATLQGYLGLSGAVASGRLRVRSNGERDRRVFGVRNED